MMVHGQNGALLSEFLLRDELEDYTQGKGRGLPPPPLGHGLRGQSGEQHHDLCVPGSRTTASVEALSRIGKRR